MEIPIAKKIAKALKEIGIETHKVSITGYDGGSFKVHNVEISAVAYCPSSHKYRLVSPEEMRHGKRPRHRTRSSK
jgi:hypothetical protein